MQYQRKERGLTYRTPSQAAHGHSGTFSSFTDCPFPLPINYRSPKILSWLSSGLWSRFRIPHSGWLVVSRIIAPHHLNCACPCPANCPGCDSGGQSKSGFLSPLCLCRPPALPLGAWGRNKVSLPQEVLRIIPKFAHEEMASRLLPRVYTEAGSPVTMNTHTQRNAQRPANSSVHQLVLSPWACVSRL